MLKREISNSEKLGVVKSDRARVLYFMMLPHLDVLGRLDACVRRLKGQVVTMLPYSTKAIQASLEQLHDAGLIILYTVNNDQYLEYTRFSDFQSINNSREADSTIPEPNPDNSGVILRTPIKLKLSKVKLKDKFKAPTPEEVNSYIREKKLDVDGKRFFEYFTEGNWIDSKGNKVKSWKQKLITWSKYGNSNTNTNRRNFEQQESQHGKTL